MSTWVRAKTDPKFWVQRFGDGYGSIHVMCGKEPLVGFQRFSLMGRDAWNTLEKHLETICRQASESGWTRQQTFEYITTGHTIVNDHDEWDD